MDSLLKIESLKKYYGKKPNQTKALDGISFQVVPGEFLGIMGGRWIGKVNTVELYRNGHKA